MAFWTGFGIGVAIGITIGVPTGALVFSWIGHALKKASG